MHAGDVWRRRCANVNSACTRNLNIKAKWICFQLFCLVLFFAEIFIKKGADLSGTLMSKQVEMKTVGGGGVQVLGVGECAGVRCGAQQQYQQERKGKVNTAAVSDAAQFRDGGSGGKTCLQSRDTVYPAIRHNTETSVFTAGPSVLPFINSRV